MFRSREMPAIDDIFKLRHAIAGFIYYQIKVELWGRAEVQVNWEEAKARAPNAAALRG